MHMLLTCPVSNNNPHRPPPVLSRASKRAGTENESHGVDAGHQVDGVVAEGAEEVSDAVRQGLGGGGDETGTGHSVWGCVSSEADTCALQ